MHLLPGSNERPADIFGHNLLDGKNVAYDVVVASYSCGSSGLWENYNTKDVINEAITEKTSHTWLNVLLEVLSLSLLYFSLY